MLPPSERFGGDLAASSSTASAEVEQSNPCPICLGSIQDEAYLDKCFHSFCYSCIIQWSRIVSGKHSQPLSSIKCPLCKTDNYSIVHGLRNRYFKRHYIRHGPESSQICFPSPSHLFRRQCYDSNPDLLYHKFDVQLYWKRRCYLKQNKWLEQWLERELQTLTGVEDVAVVVHHLLGVIEDFLRRQKHEVFRGTAEQKRLEFKTLVFDAAKRFLSEWTKRFVDEFELFLVSGLNPEAYDKVYREVLSTSENQRTEEILISQIPWFCMYNDESDNND